MVKGAGSEFLCLLSPPCPCFPLSPVPPYPSLSSAPLTGGWQGDRKSTRLNSSHSQISYALFCLKKQRSSSNAHPFADPLIRPRAVRAPPLCSGQPPLGRYRRPPCGPTVRTVLPSGNLYTPSTDF